MACERYRLAVEKSVESGFPASMLRELQAHAESCPPCALELGAMQATVSRLREDVSVEPPPGIEQTVMERVCGVHVGPPGALPIPSGAILPAPVPDRTWIGAWKLLAGIVIGSALGAVMIAAF